MSVQVYLILALVLALLLDLGLIFWMRRNLEKRGITPDDERAVYLFSHFSPVLTWLRYAYRSLLELGKKLLGIPDSAIRTWGNRFSAGKEEKRIADQNIHRHFRVSEQKLARMHLQFQLMPNERVRIIVDSSHVGRRSSLPNVDQAKHPHASTTPQIENAIAAKLQVDAVSSSQLVLEVNKLQKFSFSIRSYLSKYWLITDLLLILLATIPVVLVVMDRWLKKPISNSSINNHWYKIASPMGLVFPSYFLVILLSIIIILTLLLLSYEKLLDIHDRDLIQGNHLESVSGDTRLPWSRYILFGSGLCSALALFASIRLGVIAGWIFLFAVFLYVVGWLLRYISIQDAFEHFKRNGPVILSYIMFCLALFYLLAAIHLYWNNVWIFLIAVVLTFANAIRYHQRIHPVLWFVPFFLTLYTYRINGWEFSVIGDEYSFYEYAKELAAGRDLIYIGSHIFDGQGVYGSHAVFSSFLQSIPMKLFGVNNFSWRISSIVFASISIPLFYYFFRTFTSEFIAVAASLFIGASHYIMTFGKIGYNNLQAFFVMALVLSVSAWTIKTKRRIQYVALGLSLGLCFYVYPAALYVLGIWLIFMLFYNPPNTKEAARNWSVMGGMFLIMVLPLVVQPDYWRTLIAGTMFNQPPLLENISIFLKHVFSNLLYSFFSFLYLVEEAHFVTISYVDPLTGMLILLGLLLSLKWVRRDRFLAFIWVSFGAMLLLVGASHDRQFPPMTRLFMLLPLFAFFASFGLRWLYSHISRAKNRPFNTKYFLAVIFVAVITLNLHQAYSLSKHRSSRYQSPEMLFLRLVQYMQAKPELTSPPTKLLFLTDGKWDIDGYRKIQEVYTIPDSFMELESYAVKEANWLYPAVDTIKDPHTLVIVYESLNPKLKTNISINLSTLHKESCPVAALDGSIRFYLWYSPPMNWVCEGI